jgi:hypoxanthine phosphoribosyltransferase
MNDIQLYDKKFEVFIKADELKHIVSSLAKKINESNLENPLFIVVLNGSFLFASDLIKKIEIPNTEISFIKISSYIGINSSGKLKKIFGIEKDISNRNIFIIEDIVDSGNTIHEVVKILNNKNVKNIKIITLLFKPDAYKKKIKIDYIGKSISNDFVVGYGLDYNDLGRNLSNIYKLKE